MRVFIEHAKAHPTRAATDRLERLAAGQRPLALFITCSDSRIVTSQITGARPGELFELRTAGNIVPRYDLDRPSGEVATIEFAVEVLGVPDVVVCGHSHCAAVGALARGDDLAAAPAMGGWLSRSAEPIAMAGDDPAGGLRAASQRHVVSQLERLGGHPAIRRAVDEGRLGLHGWFYEVDTGAVHVHLPGADTFLPL